MSEQIEDLKILIRFGQQQPLLEKMEIETINDHIFKNFLLILDLLESDEMLDLFLEKLTDEQRELLYSKKAVGWHDLLP